MIQEPQNLFPEDNISKQAIEAYGLQKPNCSEYKRAAGDGKRPLTIPVGEMNADSVTYFDLVTENCDAESVMSEKSKKPSGRIFGDAARNKKNRLTVFRDSSPPALPFAADEPKEFFDIMLFYLDRIIYMNEISETLEKLDAAINAKDITGINSSARDCAAACAHCGMFAAAEPLRRLERVKHTSRVPDATALSKQVRQQFKRFRFCLKENLEQTLTRIIKRHGI